MTRYFASRRSICLLAPLLAFALEGSAAGAAKKALIPREAVDVSALWHDPGDIRSRDLFYGAGGSKNQPHGPFTFLKEDMDGTNPKFSVHDADGIKWKVKLGVEARPETTASRLIWAVGYFTDEEYFLQDLKVEKMSRLHRGQHYVTQGGLVHNVRLKREPKDEKKTGAWEWSADPYAGTREWNGLRVMMALVNNWDLKDENNAVRQVDGKPVYLVSDLGASFGRTGFKFTPSGSKGNLNAYEHSKFITKVTSEYVNLAVPSRPGLIHLFKMPEYIRRVHLEWIGKHIPVPDVRWIGGILAKLSDEQVHAAFRAAGYSPAEVQSFSAVVEKRIAELNAL